MSWLELVIFVFASYGLTQILVYGSLFDKIRPKNNFFHCTMCVGFWAGIIVYILLLISSDKSNLSHLIWIKLFLMGCISSGTSYILSCLFGADGLNIDLK